MVALWRERLNVPAYRVFEAARYARTSQQTIGNWERVREIAPALFPRAASAKDSLTSSLSRSALLPPCANLA